MTCTRAMAPIICLAMLAFQSFGGNIYYVDAANGNDAWDGTSSAIPLEGGAGPKRTLTAAMSIVGLESGDTVYAAEGTYDDGSMDGYRVSVPEGVKLVASGSRDGTVIAGECAQGVATSSSPWGCGTGALRCVRLGANSLLHGFTVSGGRAESFDNSSSSTATVGGISGAGSSSLVVCCRITDCVAGNDAGVCDANVIRCEFGNGRAAGKSIYLVRGTAYNCYFDNFAGGLTENINDDRYGVMNSTLRNCKGTCGIRGGYLYNCHMAGLNVDTGNWRSYHYNLGDGSTDNDGSARVSSGSLSVDEEFKRPSKTNTYLVDKGVYAYYTNGATAVELEYLDKDFAGGQRVYGPAIDIGCGEYDKRGDFADALYGSNPGRLSVVEASPLVVPDGSALTIPEGGSLTLRWNDAPILGVDFGYSIMATVSGSATLSFYLNDSQTPLAVYSSGDGTITNMYSASGTNTLRIVASGAGTASVFSPIATDFWYVDAVNGSNSYDARAAEFVSGTKGPVKTLFKVVDKIDSARGSRPLMTEIVYAAPGVYNEGEYGAHRVRVMRGIKLIASGSREETVIEGRAADSGADLIALRCCYMDDGAMVSGFTLRNGHADNSNGGAVLAANNTSCIAYNCVITNNTAGNWGGGMYSGMAIGCLIGDNTSATRAVNAMQSNLYNCLLFPGNAAGTGVYSCYQCNLNACTVLADDSIEGSTTCTFRNSYNESEYANGTYYYSATTIKQSSTVLGEGAFLTTAEEMSMDPVSHAPRKGSKGINAGSYVQYTNGVSGAVLRLLEKDYAGKQRVYDGEMDIGCVEYDARGDMGRNLDRRTVEVTEASPWATVGEDCVVLSDGDWICLNWTFNNDSSVDICPTLAGGGALSLTFDGADVPLVDGAFRINATAGVHDLRFEYSGAGSATLTRFPGSDGFIMIVR